MDQKLYSVEETARILNLHPKTVQRFIREGKIKARKIGRGWRITHGDLRDYAHAELAPEKDEKEKTTGNSDLHPVSERIRISTVIEIEETDREEASRISNSMIALLNCKDPAWGKSRFDFIHYPETGKARFMLYGTPAFIGAMLKSLERLTSEEEK